jgi:hypothetical protein
MIRNQLPDVSYEHKLQHTDLIRLANFIQTSIFDPTQCTLWKGYVTVRNDKGVYVNFHFKKTKVTLHRLLYINFVGALTNEEYVRFKCHNKGYCCSVCCLEKLRYSSIPLRTIKPAKPPPPPLPNVPAIDSGDLFHVHF